METSQGQVEELLKMIQNLRMTSFNFSPVTDDSEGQVQLFAEKVVSAVREHEIKQRLQSPQPSVHTGQW
jgi:hypothetical protein